MEFIHNILGMAINWTNLMYSYILKYGEGKIPEIPDNPDYLKPYLSLYKNLGRPLSLYLCFDCFDLTVLF